MRRRARRVAPIALPLLLAACQLEQIFIGQYYTIPTPGSGACPAVSWIFVVDAQRHIAGHVSDRDQTVIAKLSGTLNADDTYHMVKTDLRDGHSADIEGQFSSTLATFSIRGAGDPCDGRTLQVRSWNAAARFGGGGGGR